MYESLYTADCSSFYRRSEAEKGRPLMFHSRTRQWHIPSPRDWWKIPRNATWLSLVLVFTFGTGATNIWAQTSPSKSRSATVEERTIRASDGWPIHIAYYASELKKEAPVVVLLHMKGGNSLIWQSKNGLARKLQDDGFAVIAVDLRKHGKSKLTSSNSTKKAKDAGGASDLKRDDYQRMVERDLEVVKAFILSEHQKQNLNVKKLGIVAAEMSAPIAINFTVRDWLKLPYDDAPTLAARTPRGQDVHALALFSPDTSCPGVITAKSLPFLKNRPIAIVDLCRG